MVLKLGKKLTADLKLTRYPCSLAATRRGFSFCLAVPTARLTNNADGEGKFVLYCEDLPANHANSRESQRRALSKKSESRRLLNRRFFGFILAFIRVIRGLNIFGCGGAALGNPWLNLFCDKRSHFRRRHCRQFRAIA
jgi:hypothetical protein